MAAVRVMVVDDDELVLRAMKVFFEQRGDDCVTVTDGDAALRMAQDRCFDLVITDIRMPGVDGLELVRRVRAVQPHVVCLLMSGVGSRGDLIDALKAGVFDFVQKPIVDLAEFAMIVDRAAASSRLTQERDSLVENLKQQNARLEFSLLRLHEAFGQLREQEEALEADLINARRVQQKFLPQELPQHEGLELFGYYGPCEHLGGDFFGVLPVSGGRVGIYMVDVTGHGVSAAMLTVTLRELMRASQPRVELDLFAAPSAVLAFINEALLAERFTPPIYVSMVYAVFDPASGKVAVASAGHPAPLLLTADHNVAPVAVGGTVLAARHDEKFATTELILGEGDVLLFYSDGLPDARGGPDRELTIDRISEVLRETQGQRAVAVGEALEQTLQKHVGNGTANDDVTFIVARRPVHDALQNEPSVIGRRSVRMAFPNKHRRFVPQTRGRLRGGWVESTCVIRVGGVATWKLASTLREMLKKAEAEGANHVQIDLAECQGMDSTMLGLLLQNADRIELHQPGGRVVEQLRDMGVSKFFNISHEPCPLAEAPLAVEAGESREPCSELILSAHEALMEASAENQLRFRDVVASLRESGS